jgi:tetratricopeptide (TPR) repeat protein
VKYYDEVIQAEPNDRNALYDKGAYLGTAGRYKEAIECFDKIITTNYKDADAWHAKGKCLNRLGKYNESIVSR